MSILYIVIVKRWMSRRFCGVIHRHQRLSEIVSYFYGSNLLISNHIPVMKRRKVASKSIWVSWYVNGIAMSFQHQPSDSAYIHRMLHRSTRTLYLIDIRSCRTQNIFIFAVCFVYSRNFSAKAWCLCWLVQSYSRYIRFTSRYEKICIRSARSFFGCRKFSIPALSAIYSFFTTLAVHLNLCWIFLDTNTNERFNYLTPCRNIPRLYRL